MKFNNIKKKKPIEFLNINQIRYFYLSNLENINQINSKFR